MLCMVVGQMVRIGERGFRGDGGIQIVGLRMNRVGVCLVRETLMGRLQLCRLSL